MLGLPSVAGVCACTSHCVHGRRNAANEACVRVLFALVCVAVDDARKYKVASLFWASAYLRRVLCGGCVDMQPLRGVSAALARCVLHCLWHVLTGQGDSSAKPEGEQTAMEATNRVGVVVVAAGVQHLLFCDCLPRDGL